MKDSNRIGVLIGLGLLFAVLLLVVPRLDFFTPFRHVSPWLLVALFWVFFCGCGGCCGRRRCRRRRRCGDDAAPAEAEE
jgi:hypothetical protein